MKVTVDTNVLLRAVARDEQRQADIAARLLEDATMIAVTLSCLCEFVWVLRKVYRFPASAAAAAVRALVTAPNVETNRLAVEAGLAALDAGGDFADGVIAHEGRWLGAEMFVSFDKRAVEMLNGQGVKARML
jgi:predicted nucleic-acid-binding protein